METFSYSKNLADYVELINRKKFFILTIWFTITVLAVIFALTLPKSYRSTATLLIEAPLQGKILELMPAQFADEQLHSIYQRVMTTKNIDMILDKNKLYEELRNEYTKQDLVELFKENLQVELATSSISGGSSSTSSKAEIAFNISFIDSDPEITKEIVTQIAELFIQINNSSRTNRVTKATDFLKEESDKLNEDLKEIDNKIVGYKEEYNFSLPEQTAATIAAIDRSETELRDTENQIRTTKDRLAFLTVELAKEENYISPSVSDKNGKTNESSLDKLYAEYTRISNLYLPSHPSVIRLKREIKALDPSFDSYNNNSDIKQQLTNAELNLTRMKKNYGENHPDIVSLKKQIDSLQQQIKKTQRPDIKTSMSSRNVRNPTILSVELQYKTAQSELDALLHKQDFLKEKLEKLRSNIQAAPQIEMGYSDLMRERDNIIKKYTQLKEKLADVKVLETLEKEQQGQTLTILEEPIVPIHPEKAIRRKVAIGGFFLGLIAGLGMVLGLDFFDPNIRGYRAIEAITGLTPLVVIPYIESPDEEQKKIRDARRFKTLFIVVGIIILITISSVAGYFLFKT